MMIEFKDLRGRAVLIDPEEIALVMWGERESWSSSLKSSTQARTVQFTTRGGYTFSNGFADDAEARSILDAIKEAHA